MEEARTEDVKRLYECYPYPYGLEKSAPDFAFAYVWRIHFLPSEIAGWRTLDAGCGTGNKLIAFAISYPKTNCVGVDLSEHSLTAARRLAEDHKVSNVELRQGNLLELPWEEKFDFIQSIGVVHHLENPQQGLNNLCRLLNDDGILAVWFYHPFGEFERLVQRELLLTLWRRNWSDMAEGQALMEELKLELKSKHYGPRDTAAQLEGNADAFMHPIVNAYRFHEVLDMLRIAGNHWAALDFLNLESTVKFVNLEERNDYMVGRLCVRASDLFQSQTLPERYHQLSGEEKLKVIELAVKPRGFLFFAGKGRSYERFSERICGNVIQLQ